MNNFMRPPVYYPAAVVFVDDSDSYLGALRRYFPDMSADLFFTRPQHALAFIREHVRERTARSVESLAERDILARHARFSEVAAIVVDYDMPEMSGVEFLSSIPNLQCAKVLLTGVADERIAMQAFNAGIVDLYLRKSDLDSASRLTHFLKEAIGWHCSQNGLGSVEKAVTYSDPRTRNVIDTLIATENIVEYYWRPKQNAVLMFDRAGKPSVFVAWRADDWAFHAETVTANGGSAELRNVMDRREAMPVFWPHETFQPDAEFRALTPRAIPDFDGAYYCWMPLDPAQLDVSPLSFADWRKDQKPRASA
ncbi:response regulator [Paraburkholderia sp.]|uniref:response regulator n=1 Tax=Paraburkholderia sp. TaxID=1926495 RepID=UPI00239AFB30|nr:response regulator [Paraburkholderia sp.]MDE1179419.1 response regulator [Paraburkholderia sp.]